MILTQKHDWLTPMYFLILSIAVGVAGCGGSSGSGNGGPQPKPQPPAPSPEMHSYRVHLEGAQEVPVVDTDQSAVATVTINKTDMMIIAEMDLSDVMGVSAAHIHAGEVGSNGPVAFDLSDTNKNGVWGIEGEDITQAQHEALLAGNWYVNVHTESFPDGELRGQILTDAQSVHVFTLSGDQEVPPVQTDAYGQGYVLYDSSNGALTLNTWVWNLTATAAHIHHAEAGLNGEIVVSWERSADNEGAWQLPEGTILGVNEITALQTANLYINIHTEANPDGEIRGQILPDNYKLIVFDLTPEQEVPSVESNASGVGYTTIDTQSGGLRLNAWSMNMEANAAHIHQANVGENGDVAIGLEENTDHAGLWQVPENTAMGSDAQALLMAGGHYVNMHSADFPDGEIRGQIAE